MTLTIFFPAIRVIRSFRHKAKLLALPNMLSRFVFLALLTAACHTVSAQNPTGRRIVARTPSRQDRRIDKAGNIKTRFAAD